MLRYLIFIPLFVLNACTSGTSNIKNEQNLTPDEVYEKGYIALSQKKYETAYQEWLTLAEKGDAQAQYSIGWMYSKGLGVEKSIKKALDWYVKSANQGFIDAQYSAGRAYLYYLQQYGEAFKYFKLAAENDENKSQFYLGLMYYRGDGTNKDLKKSAYWFLQSAEKGNKDAQFYIGQMYELGEGVLQNDKYSLHWFNLAAKNGQQDAQYKLAVIYYQGKMVLKNDITSYMWLNISQYNGKDIQNMKSTIFDDLSQSDINEAQRRSMECVESLYKHCYW
ncbi:tetratricopeptide repeat protein [Vibrio diabolicus]